MDDHRQLDPLTGVESFASLDYTIERLRSEHVEGSLVLLYLDLDQFKSINDAVGHEAGNQILHGMGAALNRCVRRYTNVRAFRHGGDEFAVLLDGYSRDEAMALAKSIAGEIGHIVIDGVPRKLTVSIGIAESPPDNVSDLIKHADEAMSDVKRMGRDGIKLWENSPARPSKRRLVLNPHLFQFLGKSFRIAFIRVSRYQRALDFINNDPDLRLKSVSVLGKTDLMVLHLGDQDDQFRDDLRPLLDEADGGDPINIKYFKVNEVLKYHGYQMASKEKLAPPARAVLRELVALAEGRGIDEAPEGRISALISQGYGLGVEGTGYRDPIVEAYVTIDINEIDPQLFTLHVINAVLLGDTHVISIFEGVGVGENMQFVVRIRSEPSKLFDVIEAIHRQCHDRLFARVHTSSYIVVRDKNARVYRSLLIPVLSSEDIYIRDVLINAVLTPAEREEFLLTESKAHKRIIERVGQLDGAFSEIKIPTKYLAPSEFLRRRKTATHAVVTADAGELSHAFMDTFNIIDRSIRDRATSRVRAIYGEDLGSAVADKVISQTVMNKNLEKLTFGEARDILRAIHRVRPDSAEGLPSVTSLDEMQPFIELRNTYSHPGDDVVLPEIAADTLVRFMQFLARETETLFGTEV